MQDVMCMVRSELASLPRHLPTFIFPCMQGKSHTHQSAVSNQTQDVGKVLSPTQTDKDKEVEDKVGANLMPVSPLAVYRVPCAVCCVCCAQCACKHTTRSAKSHTITLWSKATPDA